VSTLWHLLLLHHLPLLQQHRTCSETRIGTANTIRKQCLLSCIENLLGLVALPCATLLTVTVPNVVPKIDDTSPDCSTEARALWPARASALSASVKATELDTLTDPSTTLLMVTFTRASILARMLASRVAMNCRAQSDIRYQSFKPHCWRKPCGTLLHICTLDKHTAMPDRQCRHTLLNKASLL
jgi:hypothetical protein